MRDRGYDVPRGLTWVLLSAIWGLVIWLWLTPTPIVSRVWPDGACVAVEPAPLSCDALPDRYVTEWVASTAGR